MEMLVRWIAFIAWIVFGISMCAVWFINFDEDDDD